MIKKYKTNKNLEDEIPEYELIDIPEKPNYPPRSFQGLEPLAYIRDILELQKRIVYWLTGSKDPEMISTLCPCYGFVPLDPSGLLDEKYYGIHTYYNESLFNNKVNTYNFYGNIVRAFQSESDPTRVNLCFQYEPAMANLGQINERSDGNLYLNQTAASCVHKVLLPDLVTVLEDIDFGDWVDRQQISTISYSPNKFIIENTDFINFSSSATFFVISLSSTSSETSHVAQTNIITGNTDNAVIGGSNQYIKFSVTDFQSDTSYSDKGKIHISFDLNQIFKNELWPNNVKTSRFSIKITHFNYDTINLPTYFNDERWQTCEENLRQYAISNIFSWDSENYLYVSQDQSFLSSALDFSYSLEPICSSLLKNNTNLITSGNINFNLNNLSSIFNPGILCSSIIQLSTNISDKQYEFSINDLYPEENQFNAHTLINWKTTLPIKENIFASPNKNNNLSAIVKVIYPSMSLEKTIQLTFTDTINTYNKQYLNNLLITDTEQNNDLILINNQSLLYDNTNDKENQIFKLKLTNENTFTKFTLIFGNLKQVDLTNYQISIITDTQTINLSEYSNVIIKETQNDLYVRIIENLNVNTFIIQFTCNKQQQIIPIKYLKVKINNTNNPQYNLEYDRINSSIIENILELL